MSDLVLNTQFRLPVDSLAPFQIMKQLLEEGMEVPLKHNGQNIGRCMSCSFQDDAYWAMDYNAQMPVEANTLMQLGFVFRSSPPIRLYDIKPVVIQIPAGKSAYMYLISHFMFYDVAPSVGPL